MSQLFFLSVSVLSSVSFVLLQVAVLYLWFCLLFFCLPPRILWVQTQKCCISSKSRKFQNRSLFFSRSTLQSLVCDLVNLLVHSVLENISHNIWSDPEVSFHLTSSGVIPNFGSPAENSMCGCGPLRRNSSISVFLHKSFGPKTKSVFSSKSRKFQNMLLLRAAKYFKAPRLSFVQYRVCRGGSYPCLQVQPHSYSQRRRQGKREAGPLRKYCPLGPIAMTRYRSYVFNALMGTACSVFLLYRTKTDFCVWLVDNMAVGRLQLFSITVSGQLPSDHLYCGSDLWASYIAKRTSRVWRNLLKLWYVALQRRQICRVLVMSGWLKLQDWTLTDE